MGIFASLIKDQQTDFFATRLHTGEKLVRKERTIRNAKKQLLVRHDGTIEFTQWSTQRALLIV